MNATATRVPAAPRRLDAARRDLVESYLPLAEATAIKLSRRWSAAREDFVSAAYLGLVKAARTFDTSRGVDFSTYARKQIRGAIAEAARELFYGGWRGPREQGPRFQPFRPTDPTRGVVFGAGAGADDPPGVLMELAEEFRSRLAKLPAREAAVFRLLYCEGRTQESVARLMRCSKASMSRLVRRLLESLGGPRLVRQMAEPLTARILAPAEAA